MIHPFWNAQDAGTTNPGVLRPDLNPTRTHRFMKVREGADVGTAGVDGPRPGAKGGKG